MDKKQILESTNGISRSFTIVIGANKKKRYLVTRRGVGHITTAYGTFLLYQFIVNDRWKEYYVLVKANRFLDDYQPVWTKGKVFNVRFDSGCLSGQVFGDVTCDCKQQLFKAMKQIDKASEGAIVAMPTQDGRGMGTPFKLATLSLQNVYNMDTVTAAYTKAGTLTLDQQTREYTTLISDAYLLFKPFMKINIFNDREFMIAVIKLFKKMSAEEFIAKMEESPIKITYNRSVREYLRQFEEIINRNKISNFTRLF